jgi:signal transduction histidine kinase
VLPVTGTRGLMIYADPIRVRQILLNGLSNAIKFTEEGGSITVVTQSAKGMVWIEVTDTGTGIPVGQLARMFEEFEQIDNSRTRTGEGTGIGLPLSKGLAETMGGNLWLTSREGRGTTFHLRLPLAATSTTPVPRTEPPATGDSGEPAMRIAS